MNNSGNQKRETEAETKRREVLTGSGSSFGKALAESISRSQAIAKANQQNRENTAREARNNQR